ncbi:MAG: hypothetical protein HRU28_16730, partial [Rhizobiales bacterium]|nr:hypothetical protein [Hyphomicrobiales bacterium]
LDIPHIEHVIINDLPQVAEDYIHRIGRTGRNGKSGKAIVFLTPRDNKQWRLIQRILPEGLSANETYGSYEAEMAAQNDSRGGFQQDNDRKRGRNKDRVRTDKKRKDNKRKKFFGEGGEGFDPIKQDGAARRITERKNSRDDHNSADRPRRSRDGERSYGRSSERNGSDRPRREYGTEDRSSRSEGGFKTGTRKKRGDTWGDDNNGERHTRRSEGSYGKKADAKKSGWAKSKPKTSKNGSSTRSGEGHAYKPKGKSSNRKYVS